MLVIGDTPPDIRCARAIGAKVLAVATGSYGVDELKLHDPDWAVKEFGAAKIVELAGEALRR